MTVLILADDADPAADAMVTELAERGAPVCRVNTRWFPSGLRLDAELRDGAWHGSLRTPAHRVELAEVRSVWLRSPETFDLPAAMTSVERRHAFTEAKLGLGGVLASLPVLWVNHPGRVADAVYKPLQLVTAQAAGLAVPSTLITNDEAAVRRFVHDTTTSTRGGGREGGCGGEDGQVVTKMLGAPAITEGGRRKIAYTRPVRRADLADLTGVGSTAHQFQRRIDKTHDVRVIVAGDELWAVAITAGSDAARLDFRADYPSLAYELVDTPPDVHAGIVRYLGHFGLVYGAFDFAVDHDGRWWFLECNPGGQYGWLETATGAPITATIATLLATGRLDPAAAAQTAVAQTAVAQTTVARPAVARAAS